MPSQRTRTVIEIDVDDRKIKGLDRTLHRAFDDRMMQSFERVLERSSRSIDAMTKAAERFEQTMKRAQAGGGSGMAAAVGRAAQSGGGGGDVGGAVRQLSRQIQQLGRQQGSGGGSGSSGPGFWNRTAAVGIGSYLGRGAASISSEGFTGQMLGGIPIIGGMLSGAVSSMHSYANMAGQLGTTRARSIGSVGVRPNQGLFHSYGYSRPEAWGQLTQIGQQTGRYGEGLDSELLNTAMTAQTYGGIQGSGALIGAAEAAGGAGRGNAQMITRAISAGMQMGIRETRLTQFIATAAQVLEQARVSGSDMQLQSVLQTMSGFGGLGAGFQGRAGSQAGATAINSLRNFAPGTNVASLIALRAAGFGSGTSYHDALERIQESPEEMIPAIIQQMRDAGASTGGIVEMMRQIGPQLFGFQPSVQQARSMASGDLSAFSTEVTEERGAQHLARRRDALRPELGIARSEASLTNRRIAAGERHYGTSRGILRTEIGVVTTAMGELAPIIDSVRHALEGALNAFKEGGFAGLMNHVMEGVIQRIQETAPQVVEEGVAAATGLTPDQARARMVDPSGTVSAAAHRGAGTAFRIMGEGASAALDAVGAGDTELARHVQQRTRDARALEEGRTAASTYPGDERMSTTLHRSADAQEESAARTREAARIAERNEGVADGSVTP